MKITFDEYSRQEGIIIINNAAIQKNDIASVYCDKEYLELHITMTAGDEHLFHFDDENQLDEIVQKLG